ncbi:hypothetical protein [Paraflavitalea sp. CAU 1676]|uniref:hypothetical protein n=1 Tax=Paraflavitalea sp. CAU 1676 TaxID=3032598 RepID=UPI0023DB96DC|nr:hypothetical protein [Paraflavitalea sp. CAU 1676]MDF2189314.1 hypothetical protein [Paraflavitalea sp. CAU 1676]
MSKVAAMATGKNARPAKNKLPPDVVAKMMKAVYSEPRGKEGPRKVKINSPKKEVKVASAPRQLTFGRASTKKYETRKVDLTGMVSYRLNHKTIVYDKPGADIEALRKKFCIKL